jgi:hypothetical protein
MLGMPAQPIAQRNSNAIIEDQLIERLTRVEDAIKGDLIAFMGPIADPLADEIKDAVEAMVNGRDRLLVVLETYGGYVDAAERIARIFRHHYRYVEFVVPGHAMSAGTVLVMSGDAIHMDYASVLGPIDPQVVRGGNTMPVPALGYLAQFDRLIKKSAAGDLTTAEAMYLVQKFDPAELYRYEQERELSIALLEEWLVKYKFKNWKRTASSGKRVTPTMRKERAKLIGEQLNETARWHSHSRGIPMEVLRRDLNLQIEDFGADPTLGGPIHDYYRLLKDYRMRRGLETWVIHTRERHDGF